MSHHDAHHAEATSPRKVIFALALFFAMSLVGHMVFVANAEQGTEIGHAEPAAEHR